MKLAAIISGGKDSLYSVYLASQENEIEYLISIVSDGFFSEPNPHLVRQQAAMMGVPLIEKKTTAEKEFDVLEEVLNSIQSEVDGVVFGSVASNQKKMEIDALCKRIGLLPIAPLWHSRPEDYIREMIGSGFEMTIVGASYPLDKTWLGRKLDEGSLKDIIALGKKHGIHVAGEGGEYETLVTDCPLFIRKINILWAESLWTNDKGIYEIKKIELTEKE